MTWRAQDVVHRWVTARFVEHSGTELAAAERLLEAARATIGRRAYTTYAGAFLIATHPISGRVLPSRLRRKGVGRFVGSLLPDPADVLEVLGYGSREGTCRGLRP